MQLLFYGSSKYKSEMFEKLRREIRIQIELRASHCYVTRAHVDCNVMFIENNVCEIFHGVEGDAFHEGV